MAKPANYLLLVYFMTMLGSNLTTVASFVSVEHTLGSVNDIAFALALRTVGFFLFNYITPFFLNRFGEKATLLLAQLFGFVALTLLWAGFAQQNAFLIYAGIVTTGLPANVMMTSIIVALRGLANDPSQFRLLSGRRELLASSTLVIAGIAAPLLLRFVSLETVFIVDACSYAIAVGGLSLVALPKHEPNAEFPLFPHPKNFVSEYPRTFFLTVSGPLALMAMLPMIASSETFQSRLGLSSELFSSMWAVEGFVGMVASRIYAKYTNAERKSFAFQLLLRLNVMFIIPIILPIPTTLKVFFLLLIPLTYSLSFIEARDGLIIRAGSDRERTTYFAAFAGITRSFWGTLSPYVITIGTSYFNIWVWVASICIFQILLLAITSIKQERR